MEFIVLSRFVERPRKQVFTPFSVLQSWLRLALNTSRSFLAIPTELTPEKLAGGTREAPLIELNGLTKTYGLGDAAFQALKGIDLTIRKGEFVVIMGPSGSGKSTLMNLLGCLDTPTSGHYNYEGIAVETLDADQRSLLRRYALGFIFQGFNLLARTSALENVELPLLYRGMSRKDRHEKATAALTAVGLPTKLSSTPGELSGGQQQRVAIARAIVTEPSTLFADEPTGNLDSVTTRDIIEILTRLNVDRGITVLMVTHDENVAACAKRRVVIKDGLVESDSTTP